MAATDHAVARDASREPPPAPAGREAGDQRHGADLDVDRKEKQKEKDPAGVP